MTPNCYLGDENMFKKVIGCFLLISSLIIFVSCFPVTQEPTTPEGETPSLPAEDLGDDSNSFGDSLDDTGIYDGVFDGESNLEVKFVSGTTAAYDMYNYLFL